jgi:hypothetical protein
VKLSVVTSDVLKWSVNSISNPNPISSHTLTRDYDGVRITEDMSM